MKNEATSSWQETTKRRRASDGKRGRRSQPKFKKAKQTTLDKFFGQWASDSCKSEGESSGDEEETSSTSTEDMGRSDPEIDHGPVLTKGGTSKSALHERQLRAKQLAGTFVINLLLYNKSKHSLKKE